MCEIDKEKMPKNTAYIDLLFPIPTNDKAYTVYNKSNGEKYGISEKSEIVNYCADAYRSYTFHIKDAQSQLIPPTDFHTEEDGFYTTYNTFDAEYDYDYCCKKYKYAKMAYLDTNGNILAVSNEVKIRFYSLRPVDVSLSLSGTNFTSIPSYGPPYYLITVIPILHFIALIFVIILGIRRRTKKFTK